tara:strand:- start:12591 stop:13367 length:777 start_codon:yes stop_codon:yes gene_type:complete
MGLSIGISNSFGSSVFDGAGDIISSGLLMYVDAANSSSYPGTGTVLTDLTGNHNATLVNGVGFTSTDGGALVFDGVDDYATFGNVLNFDDSSTFSISIWFNNSQTLAASSDIYGLISKRDTNTVGGWTIGLRGGSTYKGLIVRASTSGNFGDFFSGLDFRSTFSDGSWNNIVATYDSLDNLSVYVNGAFLGASGLEEYNFTNTSELMLGSFEDNVNFPVGQFPLNGKISQAAIYGKALSAAEVLRNYNAIKVRYGIIR